MNKYTLISIVLILTLIVSGCVEDSLAGKYQNNNEFIVIYQDNTYRQIVVDEEYGPVSDNGKVQIEGNNHIVLMNVFGSSWEYTKNKTGLVSKEGKFYAKNNSV